MVAWYDECMLRYSYQYFFGSMVTDPGACLVNTQNISDPARFDQLVRATMNELAGGISNVRTVAKMF